MYDKLPGPKKRVRYWKNMLKLQGEGKIRSMAGKKLAIIKKGGKQHQIIMELARMPPPELVRTAKEYYGDYTKIKQLLTWYNEGNLRQERKKEGRRYIQITVGFPKKSKYLAHIIRHQLINHERGMIALERIKIKKKKKGRKQKSRIKGKRRPVVRKGPSLAEQIKKLGKGKK